MVWPLRPAPTAAFPRSELVGNSTRTLTARPGPLSATHSTVFGPGTESYQAGIETVLYVQERDLFGNKRDECTGQLHVLVQWNNYENCKSFDGEMLCGPVYTRGKRIFPEPEAIVFNDDRIRFDRLYGRQIEGRSSCKDGLHTAQYTAVREGWSELVEALYCNLYIFNDINFKLQSKIVY